MKKLTKDILDIALYVLCMIVITVSCLLIITGLTGCVVVQPCNCKEEKHEEIKLYRTLEIPQGVRPPNGRMPTFPILWDTTSNSGELRLEGYFRSKGLDTTK